MPKIKIKLYNLIFILTVYAVLKLQKDFTNFVIPKRLPNVDKCVSFCFHGKNGFWFKMLFFTKVVSNFSIQGSILMQVL